MYTRLLNPVDNHCLQYYNELILLQQSLNDAHFHHSYLLVTLLPAITCARAFGNL